MHLYITDAGRIYKRAVGGTTLVEVSLPLGVTPLPARPDSATLPGIDRTLILGRFNVPLVWLHRYQKLWIAGITAPTVAPTLAAGSAAAITGTAYGKYTFAEIRNGEVIHESNPSPASNVVNLSSQGRAWSGLPTTHDNARVNYLRLYVSMDGDEYLFVANVALGNTTHSESVLTNALDPLNFASTKRGVPPYAKYGTAFNRRVWLFDGTDTGYFSEIDEPESFGTTSTIKTKDARNVTGARGLTNELVIGTRKSIQQVQGFGLSDFNIVLVSQDIGMISHRGSKVINDRLWFPSQDGYYRYSSGGFQFLMPTLRTYFRTAYEANPEAYEDIVADIDKRKHTFVAMVPGDEASDRTATAYAGFYLPSETALGGTGEQPYWTFDSSGKYLQTIAALTDGDLSDRLYSGGCDGYTRLEGVDGTDDDGTSFNWYVIHRHLFMGAQDGDDQHAKVFEYIDIFSKNENGAITVSVYCGDDAATSAASAQWSRSIAASLETKGNRTGVPKTGHRRQLLDCSGHGAAVKVGGTMSGSIAGLEYRGFALEWREAGEQTRGSV